jgi:hypothetical protein
MIILATTDFTGFQLLAQSNNITPVLQKFIDRYEKKAILDILGVKLGTLFIADLVNGVSTTPKYDVINKPFDVQRDPTVPSLTLPTDFIYSSLGMKDILASFVYYHYVVKTQVISGQAGMIKQNADAANVVTVRGAARMAENAYNDALDSVEAIQWYCKSYAPADYPEYNGRCIEPEYASMM